MCHLFLNALRLPQVLMQYCMQSSFPGSLTAVHLLELCDGGCWLFSCSCPHGTECTLAPVDASHCSVAPPLCTVARPVEWSLVSVALTAASLIHWAGLCNVLPTALPPPTRLLSCLLAACAHPCSPPAPLSSAPLPPCSCARPSLPSAPLAACCCLKCPAPR